MIVSKPRAVLFDWDDTIVDNWQYALQALNTAFAHMEYPAWSDEEARCKAMFSARDLFTQLFADRWQEADKVYHETFQDLIRGGMRFCEGIEPILRSLVDKDIYAAVVSNKRGPFLREEVERSNFQPYFRKVIGAGDAAADKPDPAPALLALQGSGIDPGRDVWFIGDSQTDMMCAINAGCTPILIETKPPPEDILRQYPPRQRFKDYNQLMEFMMSYF